MSDIGSNTWWLTQPVFLLIKKYWKKYLIEKLLMLNLDKISNYKTNTKNDIFFIYFFYFKYIYTGYNQSVKLFYLGALSKT